MVCLSLYLLFDAACIGGGLESVLVLGWSMY